MTTKNLKGFDNWRNSPYFEQPVWIATLSNNEEIYQDDGAHEGLEPSAWIRLKEYCKEQELYLTNLQLRFKSHVVGSEPLAEGYFFCKAILGSLFSSSCTHYYVIGHMDKSDTIHKTKFIVPELIEEEKEKLLLIDCTEDCVILKNA